MAKWEDHHHSWIKMGGFSSLLKHLKKLNKGHLASQRPTNRDSHGSVTALCACGMYSSQDWKTLLTETATRKALQGKHPICPTHVRDNIVLLGQLINIIWYSGLMQHVLNFWWFSYQWGFFFRRASEDFCCLICTSPDLRRIIFNNHINIWSKITIQNVSTYINMWHVQYLAVSRQSFGLPDPNSGIKANKSWIIQFGTSSTIFNVAGWRDEANWLGVPLISLLCRQHLHFFGSSCQDTLFFKSRCAQRQVHQHLEHD